MKMKTKAKSGKAESGKRLDRAVSAFSISAFPIFRK
jgi:hypothetical protein